MLKISKLGDYATVLAAKMAGHGLALTSAQWAEQTRLPKSTVAKLLKLLSKADLVTSTRGVHGGYQLARTPAQVSIADVLQAIEGPFALTHCTSTTGCARSAFCGTRGHWHTINQAVFAALQAVTLEHLKTPATLSNRSVSAVRTMETQR